MGILYPVEDYETWAKRYDIEIKTIRCDKCGKAITTSKPFALGKWSGEPTLEKVGFSQKVSCMSRAG